MPLLCLNSERREPKRSNSNLHLLIFAGFIGFSGPRQPRDCPHNPKVVAVTRDRHHPWKGPAAKADAVLLQTWDLWKVRPCSQLARKSRVNQETRHDQHSSITQMVQSTQLFQGRLWGIGLHMPGLSSLVPGHAIRALSPSCSIFHSPFLAPILGLGDSDVTRLVRVADKPLGTPVETTLGMSVTRPSANESVSKGSLLRHGS
jgi:hypothetical protein